MFQKSVLQNGIRALSATMPHTRSISIGILVGAGSRYETPECAGSFHFVEHMCFKGSKRYPTARQISEAIEGVGGVMNASTDRELTIYWCKVARPYFSRALDLLADMVCNPLFELQELDKERRVILEELSMSNDHPDSRVELLVDELLWPDQPMGRDVGGTHQSIKSMRPQTLLDCLRTQYTPSNIAISVGGDIEHEEVVGEVAEHLAAWPSLEPLPWFPATNEQASPKVKVENRKTDQAHLSLALHGLSSTHPDSYVLDLLSVILGEGMSSRLFQVVREEQGLAYDVHSYTNHFHDCGSVVIYAGVDPKNAQRAVSSILKEVLRLTRDSVPLAELDKAKSLVKGRLLLHLEDTRSVALWGGAQEMLLGRVLTVDEVLMRIDSITSEDLLRVATSSFICERMNLAVVGPYRSERGFVALFP
jgi:predicted Zn-dependent peptidase